MTREIDLRAILAPVSNAIGYARFYSRLHDAVIRVYDDAGNVIETHEHKGEFKETSASRAFWARANGFEVIGTTITPVGSSVVPGLFMPEKRSQYVIGTHNKTLSVAALRLSNPHRLAHLHHTN